MKTYRTNSICAKATSGLRRSGMRWNPGLTQPTFAIFASEKVTEDLTEEASR